MKQELIRLKQLKTDKKKLAKACMDLWQKCVKARAGYKCEYWGCGKTEYLNAHHIFSRSRQSVRYDIENGMCLCAGHHSLQTESAHKDPSFIKKVLGEINDFKPLRTKEWFNKLYMRAYTPQKLDLTLEKIYLEKELQNIENSAKK